ncbi:MAG: succinate dehydrogenase, cytochrome b556 subunit [Proteobacteria bacterium]|nr:succinate dehydrogenase, cytochrome b556 subunit [Pseudomonadota bacterium]
MSSWTDKRPMSPHVSIWKWHITMAGSILHRATGCANYVGAAVIVAWLFATAAGPDYYEPLSAVTGSIWGQLILFGFTLSVCYHLLSGLRHLFWDAGKGFNPKFASTMGAIILVSSLALAVAIWLLAGLVPGVDPLHMTGAA